ncbi:uncharacterized protein LOC132708084 [Cylas formicarius]|uniref:uncharacterized protein LOC132708084 n=1 Tax=Cylas formicarius TaxID=197179 RepID=UPI002958AFD4|nr:uncharacterized protein LOC132708084 [Cylas formicarius]
MCAANRGTQVNRIKNYCRNPDKRPTGPWCYTMNNDLIYESCAIPLCSFSQCRITGPGIEYGGTQSKGFSGRKCLKWDKSRKKVFVDGNFTTFAKFDNQLFPEGSVSKAKRYCRNPDGQIGGPWCFIENEESDYTEKEYCDIPFCQEPECMVYTKNYDTYMHYTDFNGSTFTNLTFGLRLWDSDNINNASARLVLSVLALPVTGKELHHLGIGIEVYISNNVSSLRYGNNDKPEFEETPAIIKSTNFTTFSLSWHRGFITLSLEGEVKPIFLAEMKTKHNLVGFEKDKFSFYSAQGTNLIWNFPFCMDECDIQTTTGEQFQQFWPLREKDLVYDCQLYVRAVHSAMILIVPTPATMYPYFKIVFNGQNNYTKITLKEYQGGSEVVLEELQLENIISYWEWSEFSISFFANSLQIYMKKTLGMHSLLETKHEAFRLFRWFSVSSDNSIAHWSFFCQPPTWANPPPAFLPECALNPHESDYKGTQDITSSGLPCLPWSASDFLSVNVDMLFKNESLIFHSKNYCRNPESSEEGAFCYTLSSKPEKKVAKTICHLRKCKSDLCKIAGTGNDFIGQVSVTRSGRPCDYWDPNPQKSVHFAYMYSFNGSYFAEMNARDAKNFCRNPSRDISGSWCYTRDPEVVQDVCSVRDCDKPEECIIIISTSNKERKIFILPQWKEVGLHGGLRFGLKQWNPDYLGGIAFHIFPREGQDEITFVIGAQYNEKVELYFNNELTQIKTFPHLIAAGKWTEFWLQVRRGELLFGLEGVPAPLFEWKQVDSNKAFEPIFITYTSLFDTLPIAIFFKCDECHTENTTANNFLKFIPIGLGSLTESKIYRNLTLKMRGVGVAWISLMWVTNNLNSYQIKLDTLAGQIGLYRVEAPPQGTVGLSYTLVEKNGFENLLLANNWTKFDVSFFERTISITRNNELVLQYNNNKPILAYWFSIASAHGWVSWSANCEPLELDGTPRDGGWSPWSSWTCSVSCGGGEGYRTRTCSNPYPNIFGKLCQGSPTATVQKKEGSRGFTVVYKGMWRLTKGKKIEVAIKMLTQDSMETYLKDYLNLLGQWSFLRSPFIVRLFGIAFINNITSVLEFFKLGPLDQYLRDKRGILKSVDLVEAASNLASAVWHLKENDIVHGKIRCRKLMVSSHDENSFTVKLTDPGVHTSYEPSEVHWIPVEYHGRNLEHFKKTTAADVWALATTLYEIFTYGADIKISLSANYQPDYEQTIRWYASRRLQRPPDCPNEIYTLMLECWEADPHRRKQPQAISRDINQLLYQVYNSRKNHSYATVSKKPNGPSIREVSGNSEIGVISSPDCDSSLLDNISMSDATSQQYLLPSHDIAKFDITSEISVFFPNISCSTITTSLESLNSMQSVFELDDNWDVILQGRIGQGFYGEVFKGQLEKTGSNGMEVKRVAVKRLKSSTESSLCLQDFEREIEIMKTLRHPNIVEILGVLRNPEIALVMEYVQHGSLQSFLKINKETLKAAQLLKFGLDIAKGMEYLGKKNIVHRDLAARNILVADENHVKISDFGLAQVMGANDYYILKTPNRELPIRWYAPESLRDGKFSVRSDVWSFGVTMCEMFNYGEEPQLPNIKDYSDGQEPQALLDAIEGGARFPCPAFCQQAIYIRVIYPCWENDPHKRPLFRQIALEIEDLLMIQ